MKKETEKNTVDVFAAKGMEPSCKIDNKLLLFDNLSRKNPLIPLTEYQPVKVYQMTIFLVEKGSCILNINQKDVEIKEGQVLVTREECVVSYITASEDIKFFMYVIYPETLLEIFNDIHMNYNKSTLTYTYSVYDVDEANMFQFSQMYKDTKSFLFHNDKKYQINYARSFLNVLFIYIINQMKENQFQKKKPASKQYDMFSKFIDYLNKYADKERTVQFYADMLGITPKYLSFVCSEFSEKNASTWIDEYVVAKARVLQNVHHYSVKKISQELNFPTPTSFTRYFKRVTGNTPTR